MRHPFLTAFFLLSATLLGNASLAADSQTERQRLQSLLRELEQASQQRQQQQAREQELARRLDCNWALIRAYEACGQQHKNNAEKHLKCSAAAKRQAIQCLNNHRNETQP